MRRVRVLRAAVDAARIHGVLETHVGYRSVLVSYDPVAVNPREVRARLEAVAASVAGLDNALESRGRPRTRRFVLCSCPACAPDRDDVSGRLGVPWDEVVRRYCAQEYEVWVTGFQPGCPFLGPLPEALYMPRLDAPRVRVPAGSVGIGGWQTGIYAAPSPSGWRLIGRTPAALFDPRRNPPARLAVGDRVQFDPTGDHAAAFGGAAP